MFDPMPESQTEDKCDYPGGTLAVTSAWGKPSTGIVWALTPGVLHAYQATNVANELWNSDQNKKRDGLSGTFHFEQFTVANGKVYVPDSKKNLVVYGLLPRTK